MSFTSVTYFLFVGISLLIYTIVPKRAKWCVLLGASAVYYVMAAGLRTLWLVAGMFQMKNPPVRLLPFFILTENNDPATEYEYRHEGVNDYITAPVNIPELIRRVLFFVE